MPENICVDHLHDLQSAKHLARFVIIQYEGDPESVVDDLERVREL